jgi:hypothetical protein
MPSLPLSPITSYLDLLNPRHRDQSLLPYAPKPVQDSSAETDREAMAHPYRRVSLVRAGHWADRLG